MSTSSYSSRPSWATVSPPAAHETAGREGAHRSLRRAALGVEAPAHDGERALRFGVVGRLGQREADPEPVVAGLVVDHRADPDEVLTGAYLVGRLNGHVDVAHPGLVLDVMGKPVDGVDQDAAPHRAGLGDAHRHGLGVVDEHVLIGG